MKESLRQLFKPLLNIFEKGDEPYLYKKSHRTILLIMGMLFLGLAIFIGSLGVIFSQPGAIVPSLVFLGVGFTAVTVGALGNNRAVSKIWGSQ